MPGSLRLAGATQALCLLLVLLASTPSAAQSPETLEFNRLIPRRDLPAVDALVLEGYLPATPDQPTIAVSLSALELYHTLRLVKPSLSVEGFTRFLCYKYLVSYITWVW